MKSVFDGVDVKRCDRLARAAAVGDHRAGMELVKQLWPALQTLVRTSRSMGRLARSEDHVHDVLTKLVEKLGAERGRALQLYPAWRERHPDRTLEDWLRIVTTNAVRDHVRHHLGERVDSGGEASGVKRLLNEFTASLPVEEIGVRPPMTAAQTARQLMEFASAHLPPDQSAALSRWIVGATFEEIQGDLALPDVDASRKLVRAACDALRWRFAHGKQGEGGK